MYKLFLLKKDYLTNKEGTGIATREKRKQYIEKATFMHAYIHILFCKNIFLTKMSDENVY